MLKHHLLIALRHARRHPGHTAVNVFGLAVGLAAAVVLGLFVRHERSYDRFHEQADRLFVLAEHAVQATDERTYVLTRAPALPTLLAEVPEVEGGSRIQQWSDWAGHEGRRTEVSVVWADSTFLDAFTFPAVAGAPRTALTRPGALALTASSARRLFGAADPVGQVIPWGFDGETFEVVGVVADPPAASTLRFDALGAWLNIEEQWSPERAGGWYNSNTRTFVLLREGTDPGAFAGRLAAFAERHYEPYDHTELTVFPMPLAELHAFEVENGPLLALLAAIALATLLIACINFVNLATARSLERAKEVGMRKALGAPRRQLALQFLAEAVVVATLALGLGVALAAAALPTVNALFEVPLALDLLAVGPALLALGLAVGVAAGVYPALVLSGLRPLPALKAEPRRGRSGRWLRQGLVAVQFTLAVVLAVGALVVARQVSFLRGQDPGFQEAHVVTVPLHGYALGAAEAAGPRLDAFRRALLDDPRFAAASFTDVVPGRYAVNFNDFAPAPADGGVRLRQAWVDAHYFETLGVPTLAGVPFAADGAEPADSLVVINAAAARALGAGDPAAAVGTVLLSGGGAQRYVVAGVVADFTFGSLEQAVEPLIHFYRANPYWLDHLAVRIQPGATVAALDALRDRWEALFPGLPFAYAFLDQELDALYKAQERLGLIVGLFSGLALFVACLGLLGLAAYAAQERTKEVGLRKVLGAPVPQLVGLLSVDFLRPVALAALVAAPVAYLAAERWLDGFAYRVEVGPGVFLLAGGLALLVALVTVSYHALRAATADPVRSLRYE